VRLGSRERERERESCYKHYSSCTINCDGCNTNLYLNNTISTNPWTVHIRKNVHFELHLIVLHQCTSERRAAQTAASFISGTDWNVAMWFSPMGRKAPVHCFWYLRCLQATSTIIPNIRPDVNGSRDSTKISRTERAVTGYDMESQRCCPYLRDQTTRLGMDELCLTSG